MKRDNFIKGRMGERAAAEFLEAKGYRILERNWRTRFGEIDIICKTEGSELARGVAEPRLVFVEVKTKTGEDFGEPWEMVSKWKLGQVKRIAQMYLIKKKLGLPLCRIDVVGVWLDENEEVKKIKHWENAGG